MHLLSELPALHHHLFTGQALSPLLLHMEPCPKLQHSPRPFSRHLQESRTPFWALGTHINGWTATSQTHLCGPPSNIKAEGPWGQDKTRSKFSSRKNQNQRRDGSKALSKLDQAKLNLAQPVSEVPDSGPEHHHYRINVTFH